MQKYDIQVTITVLAREEKEAEEKVKDYLKLSGRIVGYPDLVDWELTEFIPADLKNSCCC